MNELKFEELLDAGCHFGHLKRKWNPKMAPYIFKEHNGVHVIDLQKTIAKADEAAAPPENGRPLCRLSRHRRRWP